VTGENILEHRGVANAISERCFAVGAAQYNRAKLVLQFLSYGQSDFEPRANLKIDTRGCNDIMPRRFSLLSTSIVLMMSERVL
jgi:hypothetical protein